MDQLQSHLSRFRRRLRLRDGWLLAQRSLWIVCLAALLIQLLGRVWPVERLWLWTLAPLAGWLLAVLGFSLLRPLPQLRVARRVDAELDLKERLSTALAFQLFDQPSNLITLQRQDALSTAQAISPLRAFPLRWLRRPLLLAAILIAATIALAALPNPMDAVLEERAAVAQAVKEQAKQIEELEKEIANAQELTPQEREELLRQLAELSEQLWANPGDRQEALADFSRVEEALRQRIDPVADARQAALEELSEQLQSLAGKENDEIDDLSDAAEALQELVEQLAQMDAAQQESLAQTLAQMAARAAQAGDGKLAQALASLAQAARSGDAEGALAAAQAAAEAMAQAQGELAAQDALQKALAQVRQSRQAVAQAGQGEGQAAAQGPGQGQGQGGQPGGGGGTQADTLPPARRSGRADRPQGEGQAGGTGELDRQVYVPWEHRQGSGEQVVITGQDSGQGETETREQKEPLPGAPDEALVPYHEVYYNYLDAANQTMERSYIPSSLKDYVREYFSQLEP